VRKRKANPKDASWRRGALSFRRSRLIVGFAREMHPVSIIVAER
jgi:hypothetical protein